MNRKGIITVIVIILIVAIIAIVVNVVNSEEKTEKLNTNDYTIQYLDADVTPGRAFDSSLISEGYDLLQITSKAFDGTDDVYEYSGVEITVSNVDGVDTVYAVYLKNENIKTTEGIKMLDSIDQMIEVYGDDYITNSDNQYIYYSENVKLMFTAEEDTITAIEYVWNV